MLIKRLLILVLFVGVACLASRAQDQVDTPNRDSARAGVVNSIRPGPADSLIRAADSLHREADSLRHFGDSLKKEGLDTAGGKHPNILRIITGNSAMQLADSLLIKSGLLRAHGDSLRQVDSLRAAKADTLLSAAAMLRQLDSVNSSPTGSVDSVKLRLDAMLNAAANRPMATSGMPGNLQRQQANPGYSPAMGTGAGAGNAPALQNRGGPPPTRRNGGSKLPVLSNLHEKYIPVTRGRVAFDSLSVLPNAFLVKDVPDSAYVLDWVNASLVWKYPPPGKDSVLITYRDFPYKLNAVARRFNYDSVIGSFLVKPYDKDKDGNSTEEDFFNFGNITYNGSFGRSISFGNSQDAVVTSNLNLQISGYLADSIEISAAITDNNIPIQPDGTTANLNEFDKVFLQFRKKNWALTMGDIDLKQNELYFLNFNKRLQGASFETTEQLAPHTTNRTLVSAAIAKGKFARNIFQGQEGNQGPYLLQGNNNELYFIVLAGSEKVYIDGQLMQRGEDQDYTINYNTAEITFTPNRLISQDARIQVEFEYADRNYLNVNLYLFDEANIGNKLKLRFGMFNNSDARNSPINQTLTPDETKFLAELGDSVQHAYYPVANVDTFSTGKILYKKVDTAYKNAAGVVVHDSIYEFSTDVTQTLYSLAFSNVGPGYGDYIPDPSGINGAVYDWIAPVNGVSQGSYEAAQFLVTPKTQQVVSLGADYTVDKHTTVSAEVARSRYDVNTLSTIGKKDDDGSAAKFSIKNQKMLAPSKGLQLTTTAGFEYVNKDFMPLEVLRTPEFTRDWGLSLAVNPATEKIFNASVQLTDKKFNSARYEIARYDRSDGFTGTQHNFTNRQTFLGFRLQDQLSLTTYDSSHRFNGYYFRPSFDISRKLSFLKNYVVGAGYSLEQNENKDKSADTLVATSYAFHTWEVYLKSPENGKNKWGISYKTRVNSYPNAGGLDVGDRSRTFNIFADLLKNPHHQFHVNATYREMTISDSSLAAKTIDSTAAAQRGDKTLLARVEYILNAWKGVIRGNMLYEVGSGQQQKLGYTYLQVPAGTGQYAWIDFNKDGIQQISEFVPAQFQDQAQYIRVYTPTNEYIKANYNTFNYSIAVNPRMLVTPKSKAMTRFLGRFMYQSSLQLTQKQQASGLVEYDPFKAPLNDTVLITRNMILVNTLSINRTDPHWGLDLSNTQNGGKSLLTYGYETQQTSDWSLRTRINLNKAIAITGIFRKGFTQLNNSSSNFDSSNYNLDQFSIDPGITYTKGSNFRIGMDFKLTNKQNSILWGGQHYTSNAFSSDFKYNILQSTSIQGKFTMNAIFYTASQNGSTSTTSPVSYTILEGLLPGKNYLWNLDFTKKLGSNLELSLQYEGRKAGETGIVHTGRAALRALL